MYPKKPICILKNLRVGRSDAIRCAMFMPFGVHNICNIKPTTAMMIYQGDQNAKTTPISEFQETKQYKDLDYCIPT